MRFARKKTIELKKEDDTKKGVDTGDESQALCDECWNWIVMPRLEQDDRLKSTMTKRTVATCVWCEDYAARWSCSECAATSRAEALAKRAVSLKKETKTKDDDDEDEDQEEEDEIEIDATLEPDLYCHSCYEDTHTHGKRSHHR